MAKRITLSIDPGTDHRQAPAPATESKIHALPLFADLSTARAIELGNHWRLVFNANLVDPIFIAIERDKTAIRNKALALHRIN